MVSFIRDILPLRPLTQKNDWPTKCPICHQMVNINMEMKAEKNAEIQTGVRQMCGAIPPR